MNKKHSVAISIKNDGHLENVLKGFKASLFDSGFHEVCDVCILAVEIAWPHCQKWC